MNKKLMEKFKQLKTIPKGKKEKFVAEDYTAKIKLLEEAQEKINGAVYLIRDAVEGTGVEDAADAYIISHLDNWANQNNPYDYTAIPGLITSLKKEQEEIIFNNESDDESNEEGTLTTTNSPALTAVKLAKQKRD